MRLMISTLFLLMSSKQLSFGQFYDMLAGTNTLCSGTFRDPGGGGNYPHNQNMTLTLQPATPGTFLSLSFTTFSVQTNYDYLAIYDGSSTAAPLIGSYSGTASPGTITASTNNTSGALTCVFVSNSWGNASGWTASISCSASGGTPVFSQRNGTFNTCNGRVNDSGGSTHNYTWFENSAMTLCPSVPGNCLQLNLNAVRLENYADTLLIFDGNSINSPLLAGFGNTNNAFTYPAQTIQTTTNNPSGCLTLRFFSDLWTELAGWSGTIGCVPCTSPPVISMYNGTTNACSGNFYDTGGPNNGYMNENATFVQTICSNDPSNPYVNFNFNSLNLENGYDFLRIYNGPSTSSPLIGTYTGNVAPFTINGSNPSGCLTFVINTDAGTNASGWNAVIGCSNLIALPTEVTEFTGQAFSDYNALSWYVEDPLNGISYLIQRSVDGVLYSDMAIVTPNSIGQHAFEWIDKNPGKGVNYYKLFRRNQDGEQFFSNEISLYFNEQENHCLIVQNPFDNAIVAILPKRSQGYIHYRVCDVNGKTFLEGSSELTGQKLSIPTTNLSSGVYLLDLTDGSSVWHFKLEKNKAF